MRWFVSVIVVLVLVAGLWWIEQRRQAELAPAPEVSIPDEPRRPEPRYPLPEAGQRPAPALPDPAPQDEGEAPEENSDSEPETQPDLPRLNESDDAALEALSDLLGGDFVRQWIRPEFIVQRVVATVHSLDGSAPAARIRPLETMDSEPLTTERNGDDVLLWTEANAERYAGLVAALESVPPERAAGLYARYYPLFQRAWDELGETEPHFNDRLIDVIDHLLATPEAAYPFEVVPHEGRLHFAEESLQELSWGRKLLIRMGAEQREAVSGWLGAFRRAVTDPGRERVPESGQS